MVSIQVESTEQKLNDKIKAQQAIIDSLLAEKESNIDTSVPIEWNGWAEDLDWNRDYNYLGDKNWTCYCYESNDGKLEYISLPFHNGDILVINNEAGTCELIDQCFLYFNKDAKIFIEHYSYRMKKGEKRLNHGDITEESFGGIEDDCFKVAPLSRGYYGIEEIVYFDFLEEAKAYCDKHLMDYDNIMLCDSDRNEIGIWNEYY